MCKKIDLIPEPTQSSPLPFNHPRPILKVKSRSRFYTRIFTRDLFFYTNEADFFTRGFFTRTFLHGPVFLTLIRLIFLYAYYLHTDLYTQKRRLHKIRVYTFTHKKIGCIIYTNNLHANLDLHTQIMTCKNRFFYTQN